MIAAWGVAGGKPLCDAPLCHCYFECVDGLATGGGRLDRLRNIFAGRAFGGAGVIIYAHRDGDCAGYYHYSDCRIDCASGHS